jgi:hypothetical protein
VTLGSHQRVLGKSQVHITPKRIIEALGPPKAITSLAAMQLIEQGLFRDVRHPKGALIERARRASKTC